MIEVLYLRVNEDGTVYLDLGENVVEPAPIDPDWVFIDPDVTRWDVAS